MKKEEEKFQSSNTCWICEKLIDNDDDDDDDDDDDCDDDHDDEKVRDPSHVTGKLRGAAYWSCNINLQITKNVSVIFHNLRGYNSHSIFCEINKFDVKIDVIPNKLEKYMACFLSKKLVFIDSMQLMTSSLDKLA